MLNFINSCWNRNNKSNLYLLEETWEWMAYLKTSKKKGKSNIYSIFSMQTEPLNSQKANEGKFIIKELFQEKVKKNNIMSILPFLTLLGWYR